MPRSRRALVPDQPLQFHPLSRAPHPDTRFVWSVLAIAATAGLIGLMWGIARAVMAS